MSYTTKCRSTYECHKGVSMCTQLNVDLHMSVKGISMCTQLNVDLHMSVIKELACVLT